MVIAVCSPQPKLKTYWKTIFWVVSTSKALAPPHSHIKIKPTWKVWGGELSLKYAGENTEFLNLVATVRDRNGKIGSASAEGQRVSTGLRGRAN